jgi:hypothetical protein
MDDLRFLSTAAAGGWGPRRSGGEAIGVVLTDGAHVVGQEQSSGQGGEEDR